MHRPAVARLAILLMVLDLLALSIPPSTLAARAPGGLLWTAAAPMPTARFDLGVAATANGKLYAIGGVSTQQSAFKSTEEYDPATNVWARKAPMPSARFGLAVVAATHGRLYALGGIGTDLRVLNRVEEFDPATNSWASRAPMPTARAGFGAAMAANGRLYAIGGINARGQILTTVEEYDPASNAWRTRAPLPTARAGLRAATSEGQVYAVGGLTAGGATVGTVEVYDAVTNVWATRAAMPTARLGFGLAGSSDGKLFAVGGLSALGKTLSTVEVFEPATNRWASETALPTGRFGVGAAVSGGQLFALGGLNSSGQVFSSVDRSTLAEGPTPTPTSVPATATPSTAPTLSPTPGSTGTATPLPTPSATLTPTATPTPTMTPTPTPTMTPIPTATPTPTPTETLPPDPSTVAPPLDRSVATDLFTASQFLYTGSSPIQTGVAPGTIDDQRVAILRGRALTRDGLPLPGVTVTVLDHPEFGRTLTRADGLFDLAVNGGGPLVLDFAKSGYLAAQRQVQAPWRDSAFVSDVALITLDPRVTPIDLASSQPVQVARGSSVTDGDGVRQATLLFPRSTSATMVFPDGSTRPLTGLSVRATEYTLGPNGPTAMPADLPPTSGYTYALDFSVDEAKAAGAIDVRFSSPLPFYVENFLNFPVGIGVPLGSYDRTRGVWIAEANGRVIRVLGSSGGLADLDVDGDGLADSGSALEALGITDPERAQLAGLYQPGQTLWRVLIPHFDQPWDANWGLLPPADAEPPDTVPTFDEPLDDACIETGSSIIECQNQILGEALGVVGSPFALHYQSERVPGRKVAYSLDIPLSGAQLPPSVRAIELEIQVAGRLIRQGFPAQSNQTTRFTWDGRNAYGQMLQGSVPIVVRTGYTYGAVYGSSSRFGYSGADQITGVQARREITLWSSWRGVIGAWDARSQGLGGWTLTAQHAYDPAAQMLYRGDGGRQSARALGPTISTFAGTGSSGTACQGGDGGPATAATICPQGLAIGPDGSVYVVSPLGQQVRRITPGGVITTLAGDGFACGPPAISCGDGGLATQARLSGPWAVAVGPDNSVYIGEGSSRLIRKVGPDGVITTIAGTGVIGDGGDGGPATQARFGAISSLAVGPDGSLYIADQSNRRIRRIDSDGIIATVAGTGVSGFSGDGGPATLAQLGDPRGLAVGRDGSIYIADTSNQRVRRVTPDGIIRTIAGTGGRGFGGDGGPALQATFRGPYALAVGLDDTLYVVDQQNFRVRWLRVGGTINTLAGSGFPGTQGDDGAARQARLQSLETGLAVGPDGSVYFSQTSDNLRVRRVAPLAERFVAGGIAIPAADGDEVYLFTPEGRHARTLDALTGAPRYELAYDAAGRLARLTDGDGNSTAIERDGAGNPTAIVGPFGQRTSLAANADGYLSRLTSPGGEVVLLDYTPDGLLTGLTNPRGNASHYLHDANGRLIGATDPTGATRTLARTGTDADFTVRLTDSLGRVTVHRVERLDNGDTRKTVTSHSGAQVLSVRGHGGTETATLADGTTVAVVLAPEPRWGMQAPLAGAVTVTTPGGTVHTTTTQRTASLVSPTDLLNLRTQTDTTTINGRIATAVYDGPSRTLTSTSPGGRRQVIVLDDRGRPLQDQAGDLAPTSFAYDGRGQPATIIDGQGPASRVTTFSYGGDGALASVTDPSGRATALTTDPDGQVTEQTLPGARLVRFAYDANGNISALTPPGQPAHTFTYTERDQAAVYAPPVIGQENGEVRVTYGPDRQPTRTDLPDGTSVGHLYDAAGRLSVVQLGSGNLTFGYDSASRLTSLSTPATSLAYAYDGGLPTGATWSGALAGSVAWTYDSDFRVSGLAVNGAPPVTIQYDADGLPIRVGDLGLTRAAQSGLIEATALGAYADAAGHDAFGAPASITASHAGNPLYSATYLRDALGRLASATETTGGGTLGRTYAYDPAGRLSEIRRNGELEANFVYDANGNRLSRTDSTGTLSAVYDAQDRLLQYGTTTYAYTPNGELQRKTAGALMTTYRYDGLGNLAGATLPDGRVVEYVLDGQHRRVGSKIDGTLVHGFLYQDDLRPIAQLDGANNVVSRFVYATDASAPDYFMRGGATYRIVADHLGSPRLVVRVDDGTIAQRLDYDAFGKVTLDSNPGFQPFGFAGGLYDPLTGLVHFGAREYDPETGRWTSKDPIGLSAGDANVYAYVLNDPVNLVDPSGLDPFKHFDDWRDAMFDAARYMWLYYRKDASTFMGYIYKDNDGYFYLPPEKAGARNPRDKVPPSTLTCNVGGALGHFLYVFEPHRKFRSSQIMVSQMKTPGLMSGRSAYQKTSVGELLRVLQAAQMERRIRALLPP